MHAFVCVVWSVALLTNTPSLKAESSASVPASTTLSLNEAIDLFVTSKIIDPKEAIRMDLSRPPPAPQHIRSPGTDRDRLQGESTTYLPTLTPILTINHLNIQTTDTKEPITEVTIGTDVIRPPESITSPKSSTDATQGKDNQDGPSELDVGDEDSDKVPSPSPLDPLLAGLISIFIISTALLSIMLFLKFRQQSSHPEFHRLQDLPMDDLLEDTPLSRYSY
ncbi:uncharacterized protein si:ch73-344o19.1 isoform X3 [Ictalurus furcatus]|uniref:uncharacterized protein si:ch73-344o19.1 isoform X3 n=1 Tax=Ictalurus furcatus TaxID=66913 RepID=UPI00234FF9E1|nr:uncharacterized protein si:ch73-344o19.1 isoform X3 [Ictalurus furcatus]